MRTPWPVVPIREGATAFGVCVGNSLTVRTHHWPRPVSTRVRPVELPHLACLPVPTRVHLARQYTRFGAPWLCHGYVGGMRLKPGRSVGSRLTSVSEGRAFYAVVSTMCSCVVQTRAPHSGSMVWLPWLYCTETCQSCPIRGSQGRRRRARPVPLALLGSQVQVDGVRQPTGKAREQAPPGTQQTGTLPTAVPKFRSVPFPGTDKCSHTQV